MLGVSRGLHIHLSFWVSRLSASSMRGYVRLSEVSVTFRPGVDRPTDLSWDSDVARLLCHQRPRKSTSAGIHMGKALGENIKSVEPHGKPTLSATSAPAHYGGLAWLLSLPMFSGSVRERYVIPKEA